MRTADDTVLTFRDNGVVTVILNRPDVLNALDPAMAAALNEAVQSVADDDGVRCVIIRGAGGNFMAGGDIGYFHRCLSMPPEDRVAAVTEILQLIHETIRALRKMPKPAIAGIEGACAGFGVSLMAACDLSLAAESSTFSLAYIRLGVSPDGGSTHALPRLVGTRRAMALALLADRFSADDACQIGLVNRVTGDEVLEATVVELARRLAAGPRDALARTKSLINRALHSTLDEQLLAEEASFVESVRGPEFEEGVRAFVEKRSPRF